MSLGASAAVWHVGVGSNQAQACTPRGSTLGGMPRCLCICPASGVPSGLCCRAACLSAELHAVLWSGLTCRCVAKAAGALQPRLLRFTTAGVPTACLHLMGASWHVMDSSQAPTAAIPAC